MLLPQDIFLLATKWHDPDHMDLEGIADTDKGQTYRMRLANTIANWLVKGLIAYQSRSGRLDAFSPIAHIVGTSRDDISYVKSLVDIAEELQKFESPKYRPNPEHPFQHNDYVILGECFSDAVALSAQILAKRFVDEDAGQRQKHFLALVDALELIQKITPKKAVASICEAWRLLHAERAKIDFNQLAAQYPLLIEHRFALALYYFCHPGSDTKEITEILGELRSAIEGRKRHELLNSDLLACSASLRAEPPPPPPPPPSGTSKKLSKLLTKLGKSLNPAPGVVASSPASSAADNMLSMQVLRPRSDLPKQAQSSV